MSLLQKTLFDPESGFAPLFRLLDDFDAYSRADNGGDSRRRRITSSFPAFQPRFDVREIADAYELYGELPGLSKKDVRIEFTDPQTLHISGRVERSYSSGTPPAGLLGETKTSGFITESGEPEGDQQATTDVVKAENKRETGGKRTSDDRAKYWVAERSVGEFSRTFSFPHAVQQDGVTASLNDGVLNLRVPKARKPEGRRIEIN